MINNSKKKFFYFLILIVFFIKSEISAKNAYIALKIDNDIITNLDIEKEYRYLMALNKDLQNLKKKNVINLVTKSIVRETIKKKEILKFMELNQTNKFLDDNFMLFYKNLNFKNEEDFSLYLIEFKLSIEDVRQKLEIETYWNELVYSKYNNQINLDIEKIKKEINNEKLKNQEFKKSYKLSEIVYNGVTTDENIKIYKKILNSIKEVGFNNTASLYSVSDSGKLGGTIGWVEEDQLSNEILKLFKDLNTGDITNSFSVPGGNMIIKIDEIKKIKIDINLDEELQKKIRAEQNRQLNQYSIIYFNKLKNNSKIEYE